LAQAKEVAWYHFVSKTLSFISECYLKNQCELLHSCCYVFLLMRNLLNQKLYFILKCPRGLLLFSCVLFPIHIPPHSLSLPNQ
jgi:hypothetical protein